MRYMVLIKSVSQELAGFAPPEVQSCDAAADWARKLPELRGKDLQIEVRQVRQLMELGAPASRPAPAREPLMMY